MTGVLVLGGTGKTGRRVATQLRQRGITARVVSRSARQRFDWHDDDTWAPAVEGMRSAYVLSIDAGPDVGRFTRFAVRSGVRRLVLLSGRAWALSGDESLLSSEHAVTDAGGEWTILRSAWFAQNFSEETYLRDMVLDGEIKLPAGDGLAPFVDVNDIAAVAVAALTEDGHARQIYDLSGPRLLTFGAAADEMAQALGRDVRYIPVSADDFVADMTTRGFPAESAKFLSDIFGWIDRGDEAHVSDGVRRVLGREPRDFSHYVRSAVASGAWDGRGSAGDDEPSAGAPSAP